ncbi:MAG: hypothetical protein ABID54_11590 [Pseudomonadota bacterium]
MSQTDCRDNFREGFRYPYYAHVLAYDTYEVSGNVVNGEDIEIGFDRLVALGRCRFEATVQGLTGPQIALLRALAADPVSKVLSTKT